MKTVIIIFFLAVISIGCSKEAEKLEIVPNGYYIGNSLETNLNNVVILSDNKIEDWRPFYNDEEYYEKISYKIKEFYFEDSKTIIQVSSNGENVIYFHFSKTNWGGYKINKSASKYNTDNRGDENYMYLSTNTLKNLIK